MFTFEWDDDKAASNLKKHGITFDEAVPVFCDVVALTFADSDHSGAEDCSRTFGLSNAGRLRVVVHTNEKTMFASSAPERRHVMKKASTEMDDQDIPALKRDQLGVGVRGKYHKAYTESSNVAVLRPEIHKAFPTPQAVNDALSSYLAFAKEAKDPTRRSSGRTGKH